MNITIEQFKVFFFIFAAIAAFAICIALIVYKRHINYIKNTSKSYSELLALNENQSFNLEVKNSYKYTNVCNSKPKYDRLKLTDYIIYILECDYKNAYTNIVEIISNNEKFKLYDEQCKDILSAHAEEMPVDSKLSIKKYKRIEKKVFAKTKIAPPIKTTYVVSASYTSPQGRNHYEKSKMFNYNELLEYKEKVDELKKSKQSYEYKVKVERSKMTDSLRYDVLQRDNYQCQICGASANDGAKLHVDHIIPVSKGGKTELSNLQTLCDRCNLGKSNKM